MKYLIGFIAGSLLTAIFFMYQIRKKAATATTTTTVTQTVEEMPAEEGALPKGFLKFYQTFHEDSIFQVDHIVFPLPGLPDSADSATIASKNFFWQKDSWQIHRAFENETGEYSRSFDKISDGLVIETIRFMGAPMAMQRRFSGSGDDWSLIYYAAMNQVQGEEWEMQ